MKRSRIDLSPPPSNVPQRACGAQLGFWLCFVLFSRKTQTISLHEKTPELVFGASQFGQSLLATKANVDVTRASGTLVLVRWQNVQ
jgi:hypothetical protein